MNYLSREHASKRPKPTLSDAQEQRSRHELVEEPKTMPAPPPHQPVNRIRNVITDHRSQEPLRKLLSQPDHQTYRVIGATLPPPYSSTRALDIHPSATTTNSKRKRSFQAKDSVESLPPRVFAPSRISRKPQSVQQPAKEQQTNSLSKKSGARRDTGASLGNPAMKRSGALSRHSNLQGVNGGLSANSTSRCSLFIRQQPRAARAGPDGKDRRAIDPPPVLQLMLNDFDPISERDLAEMKSPSWVVHARLLSAHPPQADVSTLIEKVEKRENEGVVRLILGTQVSSPLFCADDPDLESMPQHPSTRAASPTSRIIPLSRREKHDAKYNNLPGTFFIFADLSVRRAGEYRLEFRLMKMSPSSLSTGGVVPIVATAISDVFRVVNAKDFDQVQPSTRLVKGLLNRGAGFPLKLKKGIREGQRRRKRHLDSSGDEDDEEADDEDEEDR